MLPAGLDMLIALAGLAIGLLVSKKLWMAKRQRMLARAVSIGLIVLFVVGVVWKGVIQIQGAATATNFRMELLDKVEKAETLAKEIPKGCPEGVDEKPWAGKVEALRTEAAKKLGQGFAADLGDYRHGCKLEWVRNRLDYFLARWQGSLLALGPAAP